MKKSIKLLALSLLNFKGIKKLSLDFNAEETNIYGDNGTGKTTIFDAFTWLIFGKDSNDRKDFEIKTLDAENQPIPKIEVEVEARLEVNGEPVTVRRVLREKWVKQRGATESVFQGNETLFYWNEVPLSQGEFQKKVSDMLDEKVFKLISNPFAFDSLNWKDRRNVLIQIVGEVNDAEIAAGNSEYENLVAQLSKYADLDEYRKMIANSVKKAKDDIKLIPTRIDEVQNNKPTALLFDAIRTQLATKQSELTEVDAQITDKGNAFNAVYEKRNTQMAEISALKVDISGIETQARINAKQKLASEAAGDNTLELQVKEKSAELDKTVAGIASLEANANSLTSDITSLTARMDAKRNEWNNENAKELMFPDGDFCCPTCNRELDPADKEAKKLELKQSFDAAKQQTLTELSTAGKNMAAERTAKQTELDKVNGRIEAGKEVKAKLETELSELQNQAAQPKETRELPSEDLVYESILSMDDAYKAKKSELAALEAQITEAPKVDDQELKERRITLQGEIETLKKDLGVEDQIKAADKRIEQLELEEKALAQQIADVEKTQHIIEQFNKLKIDTLESRINERFEMVRFKMFEKQINGGEVECCEALINGVPFSNANTASRINAGLDIINTLCEFYQVNAPIFIDNRESVLRLIDSESQVISLIVREGSDLSVGKPSYLVAEATI